MSRYMIIFSVTAFFGYALSQRQFSFEIPQCSKSDPQINQCIKNAVTKLRPYISVGVAELGLPPGEPLKIDSIGLDNNAGNIRIKGTFSNLVISGISNFTIRDLRTDVKKLRLDVAINIPHIKAKGKYEVNGQVLLLPINSRGDFYTEFYDISGIGKIYGKQVVRNGEVYMSAEKLIVDFVMRNARFRVKDAVHVQLNEVINQFLNQNALELVQEMRQTASQSIAKVLKRLLDQTLQQIPMRLWLTD